MIQRLNSYNLMTDKVAEKVPSTNNRQIKQLKKYRRVVGNELSIKDNT